MATVEQSFDSSFEWGLVKSLTVLMTTCPSLSRSYSWRRARICFLCMHTPLLHMVRHVCVDVLRYTVASLSQDPWCGINEYSYPSAVRRVLSLRIRGYPTSTSCFVFTVTFTFVVCFYFWHSEILWPGTLDASFPLMTATQCER